MSNGQLSPDSKELLDTISNTQPSPQLRRYRVRRQSMEQLDLLKVVCACLCVSSFVCHCILCNINHNALIIFYGIQLTHFGIQ